MTHLNLSEIITTNKVETSSILIELMQPYFKSLYTYYKSAFCDEPVLMVTSITNTTSYARIVPANEFKECIEAYIGTECIENENSEDLLNEYETIAYNSKLLKDFINN